MNAIFLSITETSYAYNKYKFIKIVSIGKSKNKQINNKNKMNLKLKYIHNRTLGGKSEFSNYLLFTTLIFD